MAYGFGALNKNFNTKNNFSINNALKQENIISTGRVINVILDGDDASAIGNIEFIDYKATPGDVSTSSTANNKLTAKPLFPNIKNYPLVNELVVIVRQPDIGIKATTASKSIYYLNALSLWNHPHHNALPYAEGNLGQTQQKSYLQTTLGSPRVVTDQPTEIYFGETFKERDTINPLLPFLIISKINSQSKTNENKFKDTLFDLFTERNKSK